MAIGEPADLCVVEADSVAEILAGMASEPPAVRCTIVAGRVVHRATGLGGSD